MSHLKSRTAAQRAASRANGGKSQGPKTPGGKKIVSLNALKHGERAAPATRPLWQTMAELGEDPGRYRSLLRDVVGSYPPRNRLELRLCEDITRLWLEAERNQQAQEAKLVRSFERLEGERQKQQREMESSYDAPQAEVLATGLRRAPDSPAKFSEVAACLERLRARVEGRDFSDETELEALYGQQPTFRGAGIINSFRALAESPPGAEEPGLVASLRLMILEETRDVAEEQRIYYRQHVEISRAMRLECLAPADREYVQLQRQEELLNRQLERKIKLLVSLQKAVGRRKANEETIETIETLDTLKTEDTNATEEPCETWAGEPLGWLETAAEAGESAPEPAPSQISTIQTSNRAGEAGSALATARAIALRHKIGTPRRSPTRPSASTEDLLRQVQEVYGLSPESFDAPETSGPFEPTLPGRARDPNPGG